MREITTFKKIDGKVHIYRETKRTPFSRNTTHHALCGVHTPSNITILHTIEEDAPTCGRCILIEG